MSEAGRRLVVPGIVLASVALTVVPMVDPRLREPRAVAGGVLAGAACVALALYRRTPWGAIVLGLGLLVGSGSVGGPAPAFFTLAFAIVGLSAVAGARLHGRASYAAVALVWSATNLAAWASGEPGVVPTMLVVAGFLAGRIVRERQETADALAERSRELEEEQQLLADLSVRYERARIASELHDIVGHAISLMVVQAAAGQRLVENQPDAAAKAFAAIADAAREGAQDLDRLVALLGGDDGRTQTPDIDLIDELVQRAAASGLAVTCRFEGDRGGIAPEAARVAFRVVQEGLTNALRHAPGSPVEILVRDRDGNGRGLEVSVRNGTSSDAGVVPPGTGTGLRGLRERVQAVGGSCTAGPAAGGGWVLEASFPR